MSVKKDTWNILKTHLADTGWSCGRVLELGVFLLHLGSQLTQDEGDGGSVTAALSETD